MEEIYEYNGNQYTLSELQQKYGDKVYDKIKEHGFKKVEQDPSQEEVYAYKGNEYTRSELESKYGDQTDAKIKEHGFEKKSVKREPALSASGAYGPEPYVQEEIGPYFPSYSVEPELDNKEEGKPEHTIEELRGLPKGTGNNMPEEVNIEGFDNERMNLLNQRLYSVGILTQEEMDEIDAEALRKTNKQYNWQEKQRVEFGKDLYTTEQIKQDREQAIQERIKRKQSDFFNSLDSDEVKVFNSWNYKRGEKLSQEFNNADAFNEKIYNDILKPAEQRIKRIDEAIKKLEAIPQDQLTEANVQGYQNAIDDRNAIIEETKPYFEQYEANRKTLVNNLDDLLSFDRELDLSKRDYGVWKNYFVKSGRAFRDIIYGAADITAANLLQLGENVAVHIAGQMSDEIEKATMDYFEEQKAKLTEDSYQYGKLREQYQESIRLPRTIDDVNSLGDFGEYFGTLFAEQAPIYATMMVSPAGLYVVSASAGGQEFEDIQVSNRDNPLVEKVEFGDALLTANTYVAAEYGFERFTMGWINRERRLLKAAMEEGKKNLFKTTFSQGMEKAWSTLKRGTGTSIWEGTTEVFTGIAQRGAENVILGRSNDLFSGSKDEFLGGFLMAGGVHAASSSLAWGIGAYSTNQNRKTVNDNVKQILKYKQIIDESNLEPKARKIYEGKIKSLTNENEKIIKASAEYIYNLSDKEFSRITNINNQLTALRITAEKNQGNEDLQKSLDTEMSRLNSEKDNLIKQASERKAPPKVDTKLETQTESIKIPVEPKSEQVQKKVQKPSEKVEDVINRPATLTKLGETTLETPIQGDVYVDGQQVVIEDKNGNITEIGNVEEISQNNAFDMGIEFQSANVEVTKEGKLVTDEGTFSIQEDLPTQGIEYNKDGTIKSVSVLNEKGQPQEFQGAVAEDMGYQILLKKAESPEQAQRINEQLEQDEEFQSEIDKLGETETVAQEKTDQDIEQTVEQRPKETVAKKGKLTDEEKQDLLDKLDFAEDTGKKKLPLEKVAKQVENAKKALKLIAPKLNIVLHNTQEEYEANGFGDKTSRALVHKSDDGTITIHINGTRAIGTTVGHEVFHAILFSRGLSNKDIQRMTGEMVSTVSKSLPKYLQKDFQRFVDMKDAEGNDVYESAEKSEEFMSELFGWMAENYVELNKVQKSVIKQWLDNIAKALGLKTITDSEVIDLLNTLSTKVATGVTIEESDVASLKQGINESDKQFEVRKQIADLNSNITNTLKFAEKVSLATNIEFKRALQERFKEDLPLLKKEYGIKDTIHMNHKLKNYLVDAYTHETLVAIDSYPDAIGWYDAKTKAALDIMSLIHPELNTDPEAASLFKIATAITSNGNKVFDNFKEANRQYEYFKQNGRFDGVNAIGTQGAGIKASFRLVNNILNYMSVSEFNDFLTSKFKAGDLKYRDKNGTLKSLLTGFTVDTEVYGASIFGAKIGNGFFMNLNGQFDQLTMDRWFMRQYGRMTGTLIKTNKKVISENKKRLESAKKSLSLEDKRILRQLIPGYGKLNIIELAEKIETISAKIDKRGILQQNERLNELRKAGNILPRNSKGEVEAPQGGKQRSFIIDVFNAVQKNLKDTYGIDITIADLQAVNWYPEKALYQTFQEGKNIDDGSTETSDNEQPDYESAATKLAKQNGITSKELQDAKRTRKDGESTSGTNRERARELNGDNNRSVQTLTEKILKIKAGETVETSPAEKGTVKSQKIGYKVGVTNAVNNEQVEEMKGFVSASELKKYKSIADNLEKATELEKSGKYSKANKLYDKILDFSESQMANLFSDLPGVEVTISRSKGNFFGQTEPTFEYQLNDTGNNFDEIAKRLADVAQNDFRQDSVHLSEVIESRTPPEGINFGEQQPDGSVYEPNVEFLFDEKLSEDVFADLEKTIQEQGLAGSTRKSDGKGLFLYNISNFKDYGEFINETKAVIESIQSKGIRSTVRQNVRKLWNIGKSSGAGFISYDEAKDIQRVFPKTGSVKRQYYAPNGQISNLNEQQYKTVRTQEFKDWFGDWENDPENSSKVLDSNGEPLVVYHGSPWPFIEEFNRGQSRTADYGLKEFGYYFSTNPLVADVYSKKVKTHRSDVEANRLIDKLIEKRKTVRNNTDYEQITKDIDALLGEGRIYPAFLNLRTIKTFDAEGKMGLRAWDKLEVKASYKLATNRDAMEFLKDGRFGVEKVDGIKAKNITDLSELAPEDMKASHKGDVYLVFEGQENNIKLADGSNTTFSPNTPNIRKQAIGVNAELSDNVRDNLDVARQMESDGNTVLEIRQATGWERGVDGKWRYEIDDSKMELDKDFMYMRNYRLEDAITYPELFKAYPFLKDIRVSVRSRLGNIVGWYFAQKGVIMFNQDMGAERIRLSLLHEIQHIIQDQEGFAQGSFKANAVKYTQRKINALILAKNMPPGIVKALKAVNRSLFEGVDINASKMQLQEEIDKSRSQLERGDDIYQLIAGEVEARNISKRAKMTAEQRRNTTLASTEDVAREDQILLRVKGTPKPSEIVQEKVEQFLKEEGVVKKQGSEDNRVVRGMPARDFNNLKQAMRVAVKDAETIDDVLDAGRESMRNSNWYQTLDAKAQENAERQLAKWINPTAQIIDKVSKDYKKAIDILLERSKKVAMKILQRNANLNEARQDLIKYIKEAIRSDAMTEFSKRHLNSVLTEVKNVKATARSINNAINKINNMALDLDSIKQIKKIEKLLGKKFSKLSSGRRQGNLIDESRANILNTVKDIIKAYKDTRKISELEAPLTKKGASDQFMTNLKNDIANIRYEFVDEKTGYQKREDLTEQETDDLLAKMIAHTILNGIESKDARFKNKALTAMFNELKEIYDQGRSILKDRMRERNIRDGELLDELEEDANPKGVKTVKDVETLKRENKSVQTWLGRLYYNWFKGRVIGSLPSIASIISRKAGENRDDSAWVSFVNMLQSKETEKDTRIKHFANKLINAKKELFGSVINADRSLLKREDVTIEKHIDGDTNSPKFRDKISYSHGELLNVWMNSHNEDLLPGLEANGFTPEVIMQIDKMLTDQEKQFAEVLWELYQESYESINEVYEELNFHKLGSPDFYAGKVYREGYDVKEDMDALFGGGNVKGSGANFGSLKERVSNKRPIVAMDVNQLFLRHINESSHYVAFAEAHRQFTKVMSNNAIQKAILLNNGSNGDLILEGLNYYRTRDIEQGGERGIKVLDMLGRNLAVAVLGAKLKIGLTQTVSIVNSTFDMPLGIGYGKLMSYYNPLDLIKTSRHIIANSDYIKRRYNVKNLENAVLGLSNLANKSESSFTSSEKLRNTVLGKHLNTIEARRKQAARFYTDAKGYLMTFVKGGDAVGVLGGAPVYAAWKDVYLKRGYAPEVAEAKAMRKFEAVVDRAQQTISSFGKSQWQKHPILRYLMMFASAPIQNQLNANYHRRELTRWAKGQESKGTPTRNAFALLNYQFAQPLLYVYISNIMTGSIMSALGFGDHEPEDQDKALLSALIMGNVGSVPIIGSMVQYAVDKMLLEKEHSFGGVINNAVYEEIKSIEDHVKKAENAKSDEVRHKELKLAIKKLGSLFIAFPDIAGDIILDWNEIYGADDFSTAEKLQYTGGYSKFNIQQNKKYRKIKEGEEDKDYGPIE